VRKAFISDCEGPISKNDNAYEITSRFVPEGSRLYAVISRYDDVLADVLKRPGYEAGYTLKLILPFLKAYCATDLKMQEYSAAKLMLIPDAKNTLQHARSIAQAFVVSTSYEHYIKALCQALDFPYANTYCTRVSIDKYHMTEEEKNQLRKLTAEIAQMHVVEVRSNAKSVQDFSDVDRKTIRRLDEIFWHEITNLEIGRIYSEVDPMGGCKKAEAIKDIVEKTGIGLSDVMYVGDSITDVLAFQKVRNGGGLAVSFNGNNYAIREAEIAVMSENAIVTAILADVFNKLGKKGVLELVSEWKYSKLKKYEVDESLQKRLRELYPKELPPVEIISDENREGLSEKSSAFRKTVRGVNIGALG
jgi:energy-converting hydrogenase A subunit R